MNVGYKLQHFEEKAKDNGDTAKYAERIEEALKLTGMLEDQNQEDKRGVA